MHEDSAGITSVIIYSVLAEGMSVNSNTPSIPENKIDDPGTRLISTSTGNVASELIIRVAFSPEQREVSPVSVIWMSGKTSTSISSEFGHLLFELTVTEYVPPSSISIDSVISPVDHR